MAAKDTPEQTKITQQDFFLLKIKSQILDKFQVFLKIVFYFQYKITIIT